MPRPFKPNTESANRLERFAGYALEAGDVDAVAEARDEFYRDGTEDDCCHEYAG